MERIYLDSSVIVKRYVDEFGSAVVRELYRAAEQESVLVQFSVWNLGEVLGVLDSYHRRGWITAAQQKRTVSNLAVETMKLVRLGVLSVLPVRHQYLLNTWKLIQRHHVYQADALQAATAIANNTTAFLTADDNLRQLAQEEGLRALHVESQEPAIRALIS